MTTAPAATNGSGAMLELDNVHVYYGAIHALKGVSISVSAGKIVTLLGANGAGKSTTLRTISGLLRPRKGTVRFEGQEISKKSAQTIVKAGIAQSPEGRQLFGRMTVLENLEMGAFQRTDKSEIQQDLDQIYELFPRLAERRSQKAGTLSGGEQQMCAIGRALLARPRLLLLDEPTAGIAQREAEAFIPLLRRLHQVADTTIVLVEHDVPLVFELCSTVIVMELGQVVAAGPPEQVRADPRALAAYLGASDEALMASGPVAEGGERSGGSGGTSGSEGE